MDHSSDSRSCPPAEVVKLGGSLLSSPLLANLLDVLARAGAPLVVVPGGGPFADAVRDIQPQIGLSDVATHHMAILGMEQTALALADIEPRLALCADAAAIARAHGQGRAALWQPALMARAAPDLPTSWEVTSDSLAVWLAIALRAAQLTLIKSTPIIPKRERWVAEGLVDAYFPLISQHFTGTIRALCLEDALGNGWKAIAA